MLPSVELETKSREHVDDAPSLLLVVVAKHLSYIHNLHYSAFLVRRCKKIQPPGGFEINLMSASPEK